MPNVELDEDRDGEIPRKLIGKFLAKVGRDPKTCAAQIVFFCHGGTLSGAAAVRGGRHSPHDNADTKGRHGERQRSKGSGKASDDNESDDGEEEKKASREKKNETETKKTDRRGRQRQRPRVAFAAEDDDEAVGGNGRGGIATSSTVSLAEILAAFGFVFEGVGAAVKPSVAEAFAMLRLHALPTEARAAGEAAKRYAADSLVIRARDEEGVGSLPAGKTRPNAGRLRLMGGTRHGMSTVESLSPTPVIIFLPKPVSMQERAPVCGRGSPLGDLQRSVMLAGPANYFGLACVTVQCSS